MIHMKLKCLCIAMETVTRVKRQASKWEENVTPLSTEQEIDIQNLGYRMGSNHPGIQSKTLYYRDGCNVTKLLWKPVWAFLEE